MQPPEISGAAISRYHRSGINQILVLLGLTGFTITEPLLSIFGANPTLFYFHNLDSPLPIISYALIIALLPALCCWAITAVAHRLNPTFGTCTHYALVGLLTALWLMQFGKWSLDVTQPGLLIVCALLGSVVFVYAYMRWTPVNTWLQITSVAPLITLGIFLLSSETGKIMIDEESHASYSSSVKKAPSVLFVILDEFPTLTLFDEDGAIDKVRFPNLHALSQQATWYRHYSVLAEITELSVPSILTGNMPQPLRPIMKNYPNNLFSLLAPTHHLTVYETVTQLCEISKCGEGSSNAPNVRPPADMKAILLKTAGLWLRRIAIAEQGEVRRDDFKESLVVPAARTQHSAETGSGLANLIDPAKQAKLASARPQRLQKFTDTFVADGPPTLYFLHIMMPHTPWRFYGSGALYDLPNTIFHPDSGAHSDGGEWMAKLSEYRFLQQAQYTDQLLGDILSRLKILGIWDSLLVVVTADHGFSFQPGTSGRKMQSDTLSSIAYAPLLIKRPFQKSGGIDDSNVMTHDILPTIAEILDISIPWKVAGYPAGHSSINTRADQKKYFPLKSFKLLSHEIDAEQHYSDREHFPDFASRRIGELHDTEDPLLSLNASLELDKFFNREPKEFTLERGGHAVVKELAVLEDPPADRAPIGVIMGNLEAAFTADKVLISVNGRFVTGSPLLKFQNVKNSFIAMLPESLVPIKKEIGVYLVDGDRLVELDVR
jgi:Sulfatase